MVGSFILRDRGRSDLLLSPSRKTESTLSQSHTDRTTLEPASAIRWVGRHSLPCDAVPAKPRAAGFVHACVVGVCLYRGAGWHRCWIPIRANSAPLVYDS